MLLSCLFQSNACVVSLPVLSAINEDSPTVPALLTDYILNGKYSTHCTA